jgi:hypothetical protein
LLIDHSPFTPFIQGNAFRACVMQGILLRKP